MVIFCEVGPEKERISDCGNRDEAITEKGEKAEQV